MSEELLINVSPMESRVAVLSNGVLREIYIERHNKMGLVGNIYIGTVVRVLPGMQAAFIDIGQSRTAFLHVNDMQKLQKDSDSNQVNAQTRMSDALPLSDNHIKKENVTSSKLIDNIEQPISIDSKPISVSSEVSSTELFYSVAIQSKYVSPVLTVSKNFSMLHQSNVKEGMSTVDSIVPSFRVLPTVTEKLTRDSLTPRQEEERSTSASLHNNFTKASKEVFTSSKAKRQAKINPNDLIQNRLHEGQKILVQVTKDQLGTKGARLTTNISLPSRYLVYLPSSDNIGISQRIDDTDERHRLRAELAEVMQKVQLQGGLIARTAAEHIPIQKLEEDIYYLLQLWRTIQVRQQEIYPHQSSMLVYHELSLPLRSIRDLVHEDTERVVVDDAKMYDYLRDFASEFVPMIQARIVPYHSQQPMFDVYRVEEDLRDALKRRVDLQSGGYLIIDQTEAMTTIDVNTGSYVGGRSLEDTVYKTNLEATHAIARQLRLRNLGGIIILDFIDMQEQEHRDDVLINLQSQLAEDYARTNITQVSELGLVEMTRKRTRESLEQQLCEPCPTCHGKGFIKTAETVCFEIFREIMRCARTYNAPKQFTVVAHAAVIDLLLTVEADTVADLEYLLGRVITFEVESLYTQEQYDIVLD